MLTRIISTVFSILLMMAPLSLMAEQGKSQIMMKDLGVQIDGGKALKCTCYRLISSQGTTDLEYHICVSPIIEACPNGEGVHCVQMLQGSGCSLGTLSEERGYQVVSPILHEGREMILDPKFFPPPSIPKPNPKNIPQKPISLLEEFFLIGIKPLSNFVPDVQAGGTDETSMLNTLTPEQILHEMIQEAAQGAKNVGEGISLPYDVASDMRGIAQERLKDLARFIEQNPGQKDALAEVAGRLTKMEGRLTSYIQQGAGQKDIIGLVPMEGEDFSITNIRGVKTPHVSLNLVRAARGPEFVKVNGAIDPQRVRQIQEVVSKGTKDRLFSALFEAFDHMESKPMIPGQTSAGSMERQAIDKWIFEKYYQTQDAPSSVRTGQASAMNPTPTSPAMRGLDLTGVESIEAEPHLPGEKFFQVDRQIYSSDGKNELNAWANREDTLKNLGQATLKGDKEGATEAFIRQAQQRYKIDPANLRPSSPPPIPGGTPSPGGGLPGGVNTGGVVQKLEEVANKISAGGRSVIRNSKNLFTTLNMRGGALILAIVPPALIILEIGSMAGTIIDHALEERWGERMTDWIHEKLNEEKVFHNRPRPDDFVTTTCLNTDCSNMRLCDNKGHCWRENYHPCLEGICMDREDEPSRTAGGSGPGGGGTGNVAGIPSPTPTGGSIPNAPTNPFAPGGSTGGPTNGGPGPGVTGDCSDPDRCGFPVSSTGECFSYGDGSGQECAFGCRNVTVTGGPGNICGNGTMVCMCKPKPSCPTGTSTILIPRPPATGTMILTALAWKTSKIKEANRIILAKDKLGNSPPIALALTSDGCSPPTGSGAGDVGGAGTPSGTPTEGGASDNPDTPPPEGACSPSGTRCPDGDVPECVDNIPCCDSAQCDAIRHRNDNTDTGSSGGSSFGGGSIGSVGSGPLGGGLVQGTGDAVCTCTIQCSSGIKRPISGKRPSTPNVMYLSVSGSSCQEHCPGDPAGTETVGDVTCGGIKP